MNSQTPTLEGVAIDDELVQYQVRVSPIDIEDMKAISSNFERSAASEYRLAIRLYTLRHRLLFAESEDGQKFLVDQGADPEAEAEFLRGQIDELEARAFGIDLSTGAKDQRGTWRFPAQAAD